MSELTLSERLDRAIGGCEGLMKNHLLTDLLEEIKKKVVAIEQSLAAAQEEIASALSLINEHLTGRKYVSLDDAIRQVIQAYITTEGNFNVVEEENRKLREQDRRNEVTMGELRRAWEGQNAYIAKLRTQIAELEESLAIAQKNINRLNEACVSLDVIAKIHMQDVLRVRTSLELAATRLEILTARMRGCHEETGRHELMAEAEMFCAEAREALYPPPIEVK